MIIRGWVCFKMKLEDGIRGCDLFLGVLVRWVYPDSVYGRTDKMSVGLIQYILDLSRGRTWGGLMGLI
jgi:hypothetical protein